MPDIDPRQAALMRLDALSLANYRRARWNAIDAARDLGISWQEIADALEMKDKNQPRRIWVNDAPTAGD